MNPIKKLAGQTAIYGLPSILGRILGYLLVPLYTRVFAPEEYGTVNVFYSYAAFLMVILTYGMETAFFRFNENETEKDKVFSTGMISLLVTTLSFLVAVSVFVQPLANWIDYAAHPEYILWFAWILALDALSAIPFAQLRALKKATLFAGIKMTNIAINIVLNLFFIIFCPYSLKNESWNTLNSFIHLIYRPDWGIEYIFISNLIASVFTLVLLLPRFIRIHWILDKQLLRKMLIYAFPLLFAGMAGIVNETFDRLLLRYLLPENMASYQVGIYSACYKISILMTIFIQAYRYAAEPFFFAQAKEKNAKEVYARIMDYFIITVSFIFLMTMVYLEDFIMPFLIGKKYWEGKGVIPILMMANLFLGVYYNLSIWYKLSNKTIWGAWLSLIGAVITLTLNFWWIPLGADHLIYGYLGSAWATFICYGSMMILSYLIGQWYFPVKYNLIRFFGYLGLSLLLYLVSIFIVPGDRFLSILFHTFLLGIFLFVVYIIEKQRFSRSR
ncbi:MAG: oligosaccharide flippase family protein [Bacteroidales bacterium]|jgi:O-antigen/teichoic acid export membrane protein|nr:oligosaccharide flippase family protein [Bacteroidales bacterium]